MSSGQYSLGHAQPHPGLQVVGTPVITGSDIPAVMGMIFRNRPSKKPHHVFHAGNDIP